LFRFEIPKLAVTAGNELVQRAAVKRPLFLLRWQISCGGDGQGQNKPARRVKGLGVRAVKSSLFFP
jgi:hypothetical protein